jgi:hypothetical protein
MDVSGDVAGEGIEIEGEVCDEGDYLLVEEGFEISSPTLAGIDEGIEAFVERSIQLVLLAQLLRGYH